MSDKKNDSQESKSTYRLLHDPIIPWVWRIIIVALTLVALIVIFHLIAPMDYRWLSEGELIAMACTGISSFIAWSVGKFLKSLENNS